MNRVKQPPTRHENGVNDQRADSALRELPFPSPFTCSAFHDDFFDYVAGNWTITEIDTNTDGAEVRALADADGGVLTITNNDNALDSTFLQSAAESMLIEAGKQAWFGARLSVDNATLSGVIAGMYIRDTTPIASQTSDGVYFIKAAAATEIKLVVRKNGVSSELVVGDMADGEMIELFWYYDGLSKVMAFVNDVCVGSVATTNLPDDEVLARGFGVVNGSAAARTLSVDFLFQAKHR